MALNFFHEISFESAYTWKGILEKDEEVNSRKAYVMNDETSR
jgi:uncharacterized protein involved in tolerance to divalent cations